MNILIDINKLYYKKILCNGGSKPNSQSKKKNNINLKNPVEINNYKSDIESIVLLLFIFKCEEFISDKLDGILSILFFFILFPNSLDAESIVGKYVF